MSIQSKLDQQAFNLLPLIKEEISKAAEFEAHQMIHKTLYQVLNNSQALEDMSDSDLEEFQADLLEIFKFKGWII